MQASRKPVSLSGPESKQRPVALFKNSLRAWQANERLRRATPVRILKKEPSLAASAG
jgi:hypothetical protein